MSQVRPVRLLYAVFAVACLALIGRNFYRKMLRADLVRAAGAGEIARLQDLLRRGIPPDVTNAAGETALVVALKARRPEAARLLLGAGANTWVASADYDPALRLAADCGNTDLVRAMIAHGSDPNTHGPPHVQQNTPLITATERGDIPMMQTLVESGAHLDSWNSTGSTALMLAADKGEMALVKTLLELGALADAGAMKHGRYLTSVPGMSGTSFFARISSYTPLMRSATKGHRDVAALLLAHGADPDATASNGETALSQAVTGGYREIVEMLLKHHADPTPVPGHRLALIDLALQNQRQDIADLLRHAMRQKRIARKMKTPEARFSPR